MIIIWKGRGWVVVIAAILSALITSGIIGTQNSDLETWKAIFISSIIIATPIWVYGKKWNSERRELIDKATGKEVVITNQHSLFWIPMQYWAFIYPALVLLVIFSSLYQ